MLRQIIDYIGLRLLCRILRLHTGRFLRLRGACAPAERASDPIALAAPQTAPALVYVQHPADVLAAPRAIEPPVVCVPVPVAYNHPGRLHDLVCVRIV